MNRFSRCTMNARASVTRMQRHDLGGRRKGVLYFFLAEGGILSRKKFVVYCHKSYL